MSSWFDDLLDIALPNIHWIENHEDRFTFTHEKVRFRILVLKCLSIMLLVLKLISEPLIYHLKELPKEEASDIVHDILKASFANSNSKPETGMSNSVLSV